MLKADLHIHSATSDGSDSIEQIIAAADRKKLDLIAITDHDTLSHLDKIPPCSNVRVIGGIEISAIDPAKNVRAHILGYNIKNTKLISMLTQPLLEARTANTERQAAILRHQGYEIDICKLARADGKYLYKQHLMDYLVSTGQVPEMFGSFYNATFKQNGICAFDISYIDVFEAVKTIKEAGGKAVLAHCGQQQNLYLVPSLVNIGLDGLELNHHTNSIKDKAKIIEYAGRYGLFLTGGSDYHGKYEPQVFGIGDYLSERSGVDAICWE